MSLMEERKCDTCGKVSVNDHMCRVDESGAAFDCDYCGAKKVKYGHLCKAKIEALKYYCDFCGRVSAEKDYICEPVEIPAETKNAWKKAEFKGKLAIPCVNCGQPIIMPGHSCDIKIKKFTDQYCGTIVDTTKPGFSAQHMCKAKYDKAKYFCRICGRLAVESWELCTPVKL